MKNMLNLFWTEFTFSHPRRLSYDVMEPFACTICDLVVNRWHGGTGELLLFMKGTWYITMNTKFKVSRLYLTWFHEIIFIEVTMK